MRNLELTKVFIPPIPSSIDAINTSGLRIYRKIFMIYLIAMHLESISF